MTVVTDFLAELGDPESLLRHFYVLIGGGAGAAPPNGQAAVRRFRVDDRGFTATGFTTGISGLRGKTKSRPIVGVTVQGGIPAGAPGADEFDAYYIPMVQTADVGNNSSHYTLPTAGAPTIMITSQLSGCSFGVGSSATGATLVSHIQPNQAIGAGDGKAGFDLRTADLANTINPSFARRRGVFALGDQYQARAAVIGQLKGGRWKFYLQAISGGQTRTLTNTSKL